MFCIGPAKFGFIFHGLGFRLGCEKAVNQGPSCEGCRATTGQAVSASAGLRHSSCARLVKGSMRALDPRHSRCEGVVLQVSVDWLLVTWLSNIAGARPGASIAWHLHPEEAVGKLAAQIRRGGEGDKVLRSPDQLCQARE